MTSDNTGVIKLSAVGPTNIEGAAKMSNLLLLLLVSKFMLYGSDTHDFMVLFMSNIDPHASPMGVLILLAVYG